MLAGQLAMAWWAEFAGKAGACHQHHLERHDFQILWLSLCYHDSAAAALSGLKMVGTARVMEVSCGLSAGNGGGPAAARLRQVPGCRQLYRATKNVGDGGTGCCVLLVDDAYTTPTGWPLRGLDMHSSLLL